MATLIRTREGVDDVIFTESDSPLSSNIPKPFSRSERDQLLKEDELVRERFLPTKNSLKDGFSRMKGSFTVRESKSKGKRPEMPSGSKPVSDEQNSRQEGPSRLAEPSGVHDTSSKDITLEIMPSIAHVQTSCLMTLNTLLSTTNHWNPIVPERRHSTPPSAQGEPAQAVQLSSALHTLVANLRARTGTETMIETRKSETTTELIRELQRHVSGIASSLDGNDAQLARALVTLLAHFDRLSVIISSTSSSFANPTATLGPRAAPVSELLEMLRTQVADLQEERLFKSDDLETNLRPVQAVETALLWTRIDTELETILSFCRQVLPRSDNLPPEYDPADYQFDLPPEYDAAGRTSLDLKRIDSKLHDPLASTGSLGSMNEKMKMDLEAVTMAIDRLYLAAPQLHNQRVELKASKLAQMERARLAGPSDLEKQQKDLQELDKLLELISKASDRKMLDQSVVLEGGMASRFEKARVRQREKLEAFVEQLAKHSDAGRMRNQEAVLQPTKMKDPEALLTLPEFIREAIPQGSLTTDPKALVSLSDFMKEPVPEHLVRTPRSSATLSRANSQKSQKSQKSRKSIETGDETGGRRGRSLSAPPLSWLLPQSLRSSTSDLGSSTESISESKSSKKSKSSTPSRSQSKAASRMGSRASSRVGSRANSRPGSSSGRPSLSSAFAGLDVNYIAEHHENLQHVLVFFSVAGITPGVNLEAEVAPSSSTSEGERLLLKCGWSTSPPLSLPVRVIPGRKEVREQGNHFELKLPTSLLPFDPTASTTSSTSTSSQDSLLPLLDASQLSSSNPTSFVCSSCSLPLVHSSGISAYQDLPSEHWAELVDAWMCHSDQKVHDQVAVHSRGFWPREGQALVGGSYILFESSAMVGNNLSAAFSKRDEDWWSIRCICGAVVGRCQRHREGATTSTVYRLVKYAIRPVSLSAEPSRIPLSAFIAEDMIELMQAHATYRFVLLDEEEERPRVLIWLFKPSIRLSYSLPTHLVLPKSGSFHATKVLYKLLPPTTTSSQLPGILNNYPGFPQAENLLYPLDICRRLAGLLTESNSAYPEGMRTMTGLDVGWLRRS
ncbi:hypothetical protein JAAARDRAFT_34152 [Jaapia argillacea MUCL 33604]|uniref:Uncharacterized protein n=1 Tax=Jaapia argillacea MUCL 33604 TaxID=933084 RepID=A0A067PU59_9AGAM|nr:hypothetical protein JAAARDRAFT_34152 [Jaapia argillacea MUCL 33604]